MIRQKEHLITKGPLSEIGTTNSESMMEAFLKKTHFEYRFGKDEKSEEMKGKGICTTEEPTRCL